MIDKTRRLYIVKDARTAIHILDLNRDRLILSAIDIKFLIIEPQTQEELRSLQKRHAFLLYGNQKNVTPIKELVQKIDYSIPEVKSVFDAWEEGITLAEFLKKNRLPAKMNVGPILNQIQVEDNTEIIIDFILLYGDLYTLLNGEGPVISMALYHGLRKRGRKCMLYNHSYNVVGNNYTSIYKTVFKGGLK